MKFENFGDTSEAGKKSVDGMKAVRASQGSKRDARGVKDRESLLAALEEMELERASLSSRKLQIEKRLIEIRHIIRGNTLPRAQYRDFCDEQAALSNEGKTLDAQLRDHKLRRLSLNRDLSDIHPLSGGRTKSQLDLLTQILAELVSLRKDINGLASLFSNKPD